MTLTTDLEALGYKVFQYNKLDTVKQAIVLTSVSRRIVGSMSGSSGMTIERVQVSCYAATDARLKTMVADVENALGFKAKTDYVSIPTEFKMSGFEVATSTFYCRMDFWISV
jgi:hypothetical protein